MFDYRVWLESKEDHARTIEACTQYEAAGIFVWDIVHKDTYQGEDLTAVVEAPNKCTVAFEFEFQKTWDLANVSDPTHVSGPLEEEDDD